MDFVGWVVEIPPEPTSAQAREGRLSALPPQTATDQALMDAVMEGLGVTGHLTGIGTPARLVTWGLVEPSAWERRVVAWVERRTGMKADPLPEQVDAAHRDPAVEEVAASFLDPFVAVPVRVDAQPLLIEGGDTELEAMGVARTLRQHLLAADPGEWPARWNAMQVLLPSAGERMAEWRRALEAMGFPVLPPEWRSLADTGAGRWVVRLVDLAVWGEVPLPRATLRAVLDSPFLPLPEDARRRDLRDALSQLRRHEVRLEEWTRHIEGFFTGLARERDEEGETDPTDEALAKRREALIGVCRELVRSLGGANRDGFFGRMHATVAAAWKGHMRPGPDGAAIRAAQGCLKTLETLAVDGALDRATTGLAAREACDERRRVLSDALAAYGVGRDEVPRTGVRLDTYWTWDGSRREVMVLAGLEEGGFPVSPERRSTEDAAWARVLDLPDAAAELERQARIAARAARSCNTLILSWSRADQAGSETFPGALLAALGIDGKKAARTVERVTDRTVLSPMEACAPVELLRLPRPDAQGEPANELHARWASNDRAASHAVSVEAHRSPECEREPIGPYTGLVGADLSDRPMSASSLETAGQCAMKFFLGRVIGIDPRTDAGIGLDPTEQGTWIHAVFARCFREADQGVWDLRAPDESIDEGRARTAWVEELKARLRRAVVEESKAFLSANPTFSPGLLDTIRARWIRVMERWAEEIAKEAPGGRFPEDLPGDLGSLTDEALEALVARAPKVRSTADAWRNARDGLPILDGILAAAAEASMRQEAAKQAWASVADRKIGTQGEFVKVAGMKEDAARRQACDAFREAARGKVAEARRKLVRELEEAVDTDRRSPPLRAIAAEYRFGYDEPVTLDLDGAALVVRGRVDRLDAAPGSGAVTILDYKTGKEKGNARLQKDVAAGLHVQLPLYGMAMEQVGLPGLEGPARATIGVLDFPRTNKTAQIHFGPDAAPIFQAADGKALTLREAVRAHLRHTALRLRAGRFPLIPRSCPLMAPGAVPCDFEGVCGFGAPDRLVEDEPQPAFAPLPGPARESGPGEAPPTIVHEATEPERPIPSARDGEREQEKSLAQARDLSRDVVLEAGAGAGKTYALVERYVAALQSGVGPDGILCLTFTRKAATEMRVRVRHRIIETGRSDDRTKDWLRILGTAPILTFDAFARMLVTEFRGEAPPVATALSTWVRERVENWVAGEAGAGGRLDRLLERLPYPAVVEALAGLLMDERRLSQVTATTGPSIVSTWLDLADSMIPSFERDLRHWEIVIGQLADAGTPDEVRPLQEWIAPIRAALEGTQRGRLLGALLTIWNQGNPKTKSADEPLARVVQGIGAWRNIWTGGKTWFWGFRKGLPKTAGLDDILERLPEEAETTADLLAVASAWKDRLRDERRRTGWSFADVTTAALELVEEGRLPGWARIEGISAKEVTAQDFASRFPFRHILVDEFQDTDGVQLRLIEATRRMIDRACKDTIGPCRRFVVGDPKQSIYRFRGAEVDLFERERDAAAEQGEVAVLPVCRRSVPDLTRAIDRLFGRLLDGRDPANVPLDPGASVTWQAMAPRNEPDVGPRIELVAVAAPGGTSAPEATAIVDDPDTEEEEAEENPTDTTLEEAVAERIRALLEAEPDRTIAVLTHSWARALDYGQILRGRGLPAFVHGGFGLLEVPEVAALMHWLDALDRTDDDLAWAGMLRGPMVGLSDPGLYCLRRGHGLRLPEFKTGEFQVAQGTNALSRLRWGFEFSAEAAATALVAEAHDGTISPAVTDALRRDEERLVAFATAWENARESFGFLPIAEVVSGIVRDTGYEAILARRPNGIEALANVRRFAALVRATEADDSGSRRPRLPREVLDHLKNLLEAGEDPGASGVAPDAPGSVLVTVVHQAKGLQWDTVVVPDLHKVNAHGRAEKGKLVRFAPGALSDGSPEIIAPCSLVEDARDPFRTTGGLGMTLVSQASAPMDRAESRRLFYVACTRARERLILSAKWPDSKDLGNWMKQTGGLPIGLRHSNSWMEDLVLALKMRAPTAGDPAGAPLVAEDTWKHGVDFVWTAAEAIRPSAGGAEPAVTTRVPTDRIRLLRAMEVVPGQRWRIVRPSTHDRATAVPVAMVRMPSPVPPWTRSHPLGSPTLEGSLVHRAIQEWGYSGPVEGRQIDAAIRAEVGESRDPTLRDWLQAILDHAIKAQPGLVEELSRAAARGDVHHEARVSVTFDAEGERVTGAIDLLFRDDGGEWRILDYKTDAAEGSLAEFQRTYHGQVALYARALGGLLPPIQVVRIGLWRLKSGHVVEWSR
ncbi:MAG TPA: PD-(D/E)XK nuclease family protein [Myxococcota bacterium]|nr:PD-(D/E)XK nuclease family protein [Myxococcota bacterium]